MRKLPRHHTEIYIKKTLQTPPVLLIKDPEFCSIPEHISDYKARRLLIDEIKHHILFKSVTISHREDITSVTFTLRDKRHHASRESLEHLTKFIFYKCFYAKPHLEETSL